MRRFQKWLAYGTLSYLFFVIYGSLVPLEYSDRPLSDALAAFSPPPWYAIGAADRADWIANLVLYVPLAFLLLAASHAARPKVASAFRSVFAMASLVLLAIVIEFLQLFFPPRSVSLNDLAAEVAGIVLGGFLWFAVGNRFLALTGSALRVPANVRRAVAIVFVVGYIAVALFPFDIVVSLAELREKLASDLVGLWVAPSACSSLATCLGYGLLEIVGGAMFGVAWFWMQSRVSTPSAKSAAFLGLVVGAGIEVAQVLLLSGVSQGTSVLARGFGIALGYRHAAKLPQVLASELDWRRGRWWLGVGSAAYLVTLLLVNGWFRTSVGTIPEAIARLEDLHYVPFYYYYYVSEQWALKSALVQVAMYSPVGVMVAIAEGPQPSGRARVGWVAALFAAILALMIEVGKLFLGKRPDPTDILFALGASYIAYRLSSYTISRATISRQDTAPSPLSSPEPSPLSMLGPGVVIGAILLLFVAFGVLRYPGSAGWLAAGLGLYGFMLLRKPSYWLAVIPALLPFLDLGQWTGWLFLDEFDLVIMVTVGMLTLVPLRERSQLWPAGLKFLLFVWALAAVLAFLRGFLPMESLSPDSFWGIHRHTNALRAGRGILWVLLLLVLFRRWAADRDSNIDLFARGMTLGLAGVGAVVLWERVTFAGFWNFTSDYRAVGALSAVSTAGAQLESFLAAAAPFALLLMIRGRGWHWRAIAVLALGLGSYAVVATESRTALVGVVLSTSVFLAGFVRVPGRFAVRRPLSSFGWIALILAFATGLAVIAPATLSRFGHGASDFDARREHWKSVVAMIGADWVNQLAGMGLGTFPAAFYWNAPPDRKPSLFSFNHDGREAYVRIGAGAGMYLDQIVSIDPVRRYTVQARIRSAIAGSVLNLSLCDKWILFSTACGEVTLQTHSPDRWEPVRAEIDSSGLAIGAWPFRPTVKLSLKGSAAQASLDVTDVQLTDAEGHDFVKNGQFALAGTFWFVSGDENPWPWNIFNLFVEVYFEQGWIGLVSFLLLLGYSLARLTAQAWRGDNRASACLAAILGFLVPALFDSVIDEPRMRLLLMLLLVLPVLTTTRDAAGQLSSDGEKTSPNPPRRMAPV